MSSVAVNVMNSCNLVNGWYECQWQSNVNCLVKLNCCSHTTHIYTYTPLTSTLTHHSHLHVHTTHIYTYTPLTHHSHLHLHTTHIYTYTPLTSTRTHHSHLHLHTTHIYTYTPLTSTLTHHSHLHLHTTLTTCITPHQCTNSPQHWLSLMWMCNA